VSAPGIYIELPIATSMERLWELTQQPHLHQRWDLRFTEIQYLPKTTETQHFLYVTRIGAGISIAGTGESIATHTAADGSATSSLRFASDDPKSLIRTGSGYWRYIPGETQITFLTWYDYETRFGLFGRVFDLVFRPVMGWATAWSFDRLRLWAEEDQAPEISLTLALIHALARIAIAFTWLWHGLVPKLLFRNHDELAMLVQSGVSTSFLPWIGSAEIVLAVLTLVTWRHRGVLVLNAIVMVAALGAVAFRSPAYLTAAFNPVTLNLGVVALSLTGFLAARCIPFAGRCRRRASTGKKEQS
jgi:hypothetical protein